MFYTKVLVVAKLLTNRNRSKSILQVNLDGLCILVIYEFRLLKKPQCFI